MITTKLAVIYRQCILIFCLQLQPVFFFPFKFKNQKDVSSRWNNIFLFPVDGVLRLSSLWLLSDVVINLNLFNRCDASRHLIFPTFFAFKHNTNSGRNRAGPWLFFTRRRRRLFQNHLWLRTYRFIVSIIVYIVCHRDA